MKTLIVVLCLVCFPGIALAQAVCGDRLKFLNHLAKTHQEAPTSIGLTTSGQVVEILTSQVGTFTIMVTAPNGQACIVAAGEAWEHIKRTATDPKL